MYCETYHNDMVPRHLDLAALFDEIHRRRPFGRGVVSGMMGVRHFSMDHQVHLVMSVRVDLDRRVIATGHVGPDGLAESEDLWVRRRELGRLRCPLVKKAIKFSCGRKPTNLLFLWPFWRSLRILHWL